MAHVEVPEGYVAKLVEQLQIMPMGGLVDSDELHALIRDKEAIAIEALEWVADNAVHRVHSVGAIPELQKEILERVRAIPPSRELDRLQDLIDAVIVVSGHNRLENDRLRDELRQMREEGFLERIKRWWKERA